MWNEPEESLPDEILIYIGVYVPHLIISNRSDLDIEIARGVARGDLHPMTKAPLAPSMGDKENIVVISSLIKLTFAIKTCGLYIHIQIETRDSKEIHSIILLTTIKVLARYHSRCPKA